MSAGEKLVGGLLAYTGDAVGAVLPYTSGKPWMLTEGLAKQDAHSPLMHGLMLNDETSM
jgi:hypothetical protein